MIVNIFRILIASLDTKKFEESKNNSGVTSNNKNESYDSNDSNDDSISDFSASNHKAHNMGNQLPV